MVCCSVGPSSYVVGNRLGRVKLLHLRFILKAIIRLKKIIVKKPKMAKKVGNHDVEVSIRAGKVGKFRLGLGMVEVLGSVKMFLKKHSKVFLWVRFPVKGKKTNEQILASNVLNDICTLF